MTARTPDPATADALPCGEFAVTALPGFEFRIDRADPRIRVSTALLDVAARAQAPFVTLEPPPGGCDLTYVGAVLKIHGVNRTVIYRITNWLSGIDACIAEWPD